MSFHRESNILNGTLLVVLAFFTWLMADITVAYIPYETDVGFLRIKQRYLDKDHWRIAFFIHVYASIWVLLAGFTQFSGFILARIPVLHRAMGWTYAANVLFVTGPAGLLMGFYANGGLVSRVSFVSLGLLWMGFTGKALYAALRRDIPSHRRFMIRSFALTLSALTLRAWKWGITNSIEMPPMDVYRAVAWLGWIPNLMIAEWLLRRERIGFGSKGKPGLAGKPDRS